MSRFLRDAYQSMKAYTPGTQPKRRDGMIKLNTNESPYPPAPGALNAVNRALLEDLRLYNDIDATQVSQAIAEHYGVRREQVLVGNGSDELLAFAMLAFGGDGAAFPDITYGFYPVWADLFGIVRREIPLRDDFTIDPADYLSDASMVLIANPNAPTGIALPLSDICRIAQANKNHVVLVDEAYVDFGGESAVGCIGTHENLLIVKTFSKSRSLAGGRLGYAIGPEALIADLNKIKFGFNPYNVNSLTNAVGAAAMRDKEYFASCCQRIVATRERCAKALEVLGFSVLPSKANFLFARHPGVSGARLLEALAARNILVRRFDGPRISDCLRISIGTDAQMDTLAAALGAILAEEGAL